MAKEYPRVEVMIGGETTIIRDMTAEEREAYDFVNGEQWTPELKRAEQIKADPKLHTAAKNMARQEAQSLQKIARKK